MKNDSNYKVLEKDCTNINYMSDFKMQDQKILICEKDHLLVRTKVALPVYPEFYTNMENNGISPNQLKSDNPRDKHAYSKIGNNGDHSYPDTFESSLLFLNLSIHKKYNAPTFLDIIGQDNRMQELLKSIKDLAKFNFPVFIQGERGTGKELIAKEIHYQSFKMNKPFILVNCQELTEESLEKELFGYVKGVFSEGMAEQQGKIELAAGGTLFLKGLSSTPKTIQEKLLKVLREGKIRRLGSNKDIPVHFQIISSSNLNLNNEVKNGNFLSELYDRINIAPLKLPPLRERKNDIPILVDYFLERTKYKGHTALGIAKDTIEILVDYSWPVNVLELKSVIHYAVTNAKGQVIQPHNLPGEFYSIRKKYEIQENQLACSPSVGRPLKLDLARVEEALQKSGGNKAQAARLLLVGRATLYKFLNNCPKLYNSFVKTTKG